MTQVRRDDSDDDELKETCLQVCVCVYVYMGCVDTYMRAGVQVC